MTLIQIIFLSGIYDRCWHSSTDRKDHRLKRSYLCIFCPKVHGCNNDKEKKSKTNPTNESLKLGLFFKKRVGTFLFWFWLPDFCVYYNVSAHGPQGLVLPSEAGTRGPVLPRAHSGERWSALGPPLQFSQV